METERITLSQRERDRLKVWHEVQQKHLTQVAAAARLKVTDRQVRRMLLRIREHGDGALVHGLRGRPSITPGEDHGSGHSYLAKTRTFLLCVDRSYSHLPGHEAMGTGLRPLFGICGKSGELNRDLTAAWGEAWSPIPRYHPGRPAPHAASR